MLQFFEAAHQYFKQIARKQNFINLPLSLAKRHQLFKCSSFGDLKENPISHPLFLTEKKYDVLRKVSYDKVNNLRKTI